MLGPLPYIGGKNRLATKIIALLPEHTTYVEPFAGGAQVLFHKAPSNVEVLNDLDFDIVNFFRVCQWHCEELIRYLRYCLASRRLHELHVKTDPETLTDIQRAGRFFYLQKNSFGGLVLKHRFHYGVTHPTNYNPDRIPEIIEQAHRRLARVQIESLPPLAAICAAISALASLGAVLLYGRSHPQALPAAGRPAPVRSAPAPKEREPESKARLSLADEFLEGCE